MKAKIEHMLKIQNEVNCIVHPDWKTQNFQWRRAAWVECAEMMDHIGWKWWKKQTPNVEQAKLELVDIWHFILSMAMEYDYDSSYIIEKSNFSPKDEVSHGLTLCMIENLAVSLLKANFKIILESFSDCCGQVNLSFDELYKTYIGKSVLNKFRQANGYKDGTYLKIWFGKEDNDYLYELLGLLDSDHEDFVASIETSLTNAYKLVTEATADL